MYNLVTIIERMRGLSLQVSDAYPHSPLSDGLRHLDDLIVSFEQYVVNKSPGWIRLKWRFDRHEESADLWEACDLEDPVTNPDLARLEARLWRLWRGLRSIYCGTTDSRNRHSRIHIEMLHFSQGWVILRHALENRDGPPRCFSHPYILTLLADLERDGLIRAKE